MNQVWKVRSLSMQTQHGTFWLSPYPGEGCSASRCWTDADGVSHHEWLGGVGTLHMHASVAEARKAVRERLAELVEGVCTPLSSGFASECLEACR